MDWVKNLLIQKKIQKNGGKWSIISALLKTYLIEGSYTDNADLIYNWRKQNVLDENFYNALDRNSEDIVSVLRDYLIKEYKSESSSDSSSSVSSTKIFNVIKRM
jgi:hypothetical protein